MNPITSLQAMLSIAKGVDIFVALFICIGWSFMEKNEYNYAVICFGMALVLATVVIICKSKYHVEQNRQITPSNPNETE